MSIEVFAHFLTTSISICLSLKMWRTKVVWSRQMPVIPLSATKKCKDRSLSKEIGFASQLTTAPFLRSWVSLSPCTEFTIGSWSSKLITQPISRRSLSACATSETMWVKRMFTDQSQQSSSIASIQPFGTMDSKCKYFQTNTSRSDSQWKTQISFELQSTCAMLTTSNDFGQNNNNINRTRELATMRLMSTQGV